MKKAIVAFGLSSRDEDIHVVGDGLINDTWKVSGADGNAFILQRINHNVFKHPAQIDENIRLLKEFLTKYSPDYLSCPLPSTSGSTLLEIDGDFFRLFEFVRDSHCFTVLNEPSLAYEAAKEFGLFTSLLADFDASQLACTIPDFHNLTLRYDSYRASLFTASSERLELARSCIDIIEKHADIVDVYKSILVNDQIPQRVCHHDTKISNVLFNSRRKGLCVIDLDTVMPGYFFSDIGDMFRTYLSADSEETIITTPGQPRIRLDYFESIVSGYLYHMCDHLTTDERNCILYAGKFMLFMQGVRFLTDFLNCDVYYKTTRPLHNLDRAYNQLTLLEEYCSLEPQLQAILERM